MTTIAARYESDAITRLLRAPDEERDVEWLKEALQQAVLIELATIPPYSTALWSIDRTLDMEIEIYQDIREIIFDEMSHFGLVCNMLTTIGGTPLLADEAVVPKYPGPLPGGVRPCIRAFLSGLNRDSVELFSEIEKPETPIITLRAEGLRPGETYSSIGVFYDAILDTFRTSQVEFTGERQVKFPLGTKHGKGNDIVPITKLEDVEKAIKIIKEQGEGTGTSPENPFPGKEGELSHYYTFREMYHGKKLVKNPTTGKWEFTGPAVELPPAHPVAVVPRGGWQNDPVNRPNPTTQALLDSFNEAYTDMLQGLEGAWGSPQQPIGTAIGAMGEMREIAGEIVVIPLPDGSGRTYGPEFLFRRK
ncbi:ferritin-like domain-containing protein [Streptomyces chattanoogensis]|uniref:ferritin-like domain-containing protein n=1 Tax=Streptomyces chattanoogensis TaxID=66876 RepID=UPI00368E9BDA